MLIFRFKLEECLRKHHKSLQSEECRTLLFEEEKEESQDPELDYRLMHVCKPMIKRLSQIKDLPNKNKY